MESNKDRCRKDGNAIEERKVEGIVVKERCSENLGGIAMEEKKELKEGILKIGKGRKKWIVTKRVAEKMEVQ